MYVHLKHGVQIKLSILKNYIKINYFCQLTLYFSNVNAVLEFIRAHRIVKCI